MRTIYINVYENKGGFAAGWAASMGIAFGIPDSKNQIAWGESLIYPTKEAAWDTIASKVERLDFSQDHIYFNHEHVTDHGRILSIVAAL